MAATDAPPPTPATSPPLRDARLPISRPRVLRPALKPQACGRPARCPTSLMHGSPDPAAGTTRRTAKTCLPRILRPSGRRWADGLRSRARPHAPSQVVTATALSSDERRDRAQHLALAAASSRRRGTGWPDHVGRLASAAGEEGKTIRASRPIPATVDSSGGRASQGETPRPKPRPPVNQRVVRPADASTLGHVAPAAAWRDRDG